MNDFNNPNLINEDVLNSLTIEQLNKLAEILKDVK
jgi:predicted transcriptional regulator